MANYFEITAPKISNAMVDFSPLTNALGSMAQNQRQQFRDAYALKQDDYEKTRQAQQDKIAAEQRQYERSIADRNYKDSVAKELAIGASRLRYLPKEQQLPYWQSLVKRHHAVFGTDGITPEDEDINTGPMRMAAYSGVIDDPLPRQLVQSQIAENNSTAEKNRAAAANGGSDFGKTIYPGFNKNGEPVNLVQNKGKLEMIEAPEGVSFDVTKAAELKKAAQNRADAKAALPDILDAAGTMQTQIKSIKDDTALDNVIGWLDSKKPEWALGADSARVQSKINNLNANAYLMAFQKMRGAGAITDKEGGVAQEALSRLRFQNLSEDDYRQAITDLEKVIHNGVIKAKIKAGELPETEMSKLYKFGDEADPFAPSDDKLVGSLDSTSSGIKIKQVR